MLGGVKIPFSQGLKGHSDGDVLLHAVIDGILGALAMGDIGEHFPDTDPRWKDISSRKLLSSVMDMIREKWVILNVDATVITEEPRLAPYKDAICAVIAEECGVDPGQVSVKAKTNEGMGFTGRKEGIAVLAAVTVGGRDESTDH